MRHNSWVKLQRINHIHILPPSVNEILQLKRTGFGPFSNPISNFDWVELNLSCFTLLAPILAEYLLRDHRTVFRLDRRKHSSTYYIGNNLAIQTAYHTSWTFSSDTREPRTLPWGTPVVAFSDSLLCPSTFILNYYYHYYYYHYCYYHNCWCGLCFLVLLLLHVKF